MNPEGERSDARIPTDSRAGAVSSPQAAAISPRMVWRGRVGWEKGGRLKEERGATWPPESLPWGGWLWPGLEGVSPCRMAVPPFSCSASPAGEGEGLYDRQLPAPAGRDCSRLEGAAGSSAQPFTCHPSSFAQSKFDGVVHPGECLPQHKRQAPWGTIAAVARN